MKKLLLLVSLIPAILHAQVSMHIHHSDGSVTVIEAAEMDSVFFPLDPMNQNVHLVTGDVQSDPMLLIDSVTFSGIVQIPPTCFDGIQNNGEFAPDCGGPCPPCGTCADGIQNEVWVPEINAFVMEAGIDCGGPCPFPCPPSCYDGIQNGDEEGVDCGGSFCPPCPPPTCYDGVWNGLETGVDCGGPDCPPCPPPTCTDGIQNGNEEGIDCGGVCPQECADPTCYDGVQNQGEEGIDCGGPCPMMCPDPNCNDGVQNQGEEWIDCGGPCPNICPTCDDGVQNGPESAVDCVIGDMQGYYGGLCPQCPTCYDEIQNQFETYVDCGGPNCPPCEMYLNAENAGCGAESGPFIGENFQFTQQGFGYILSATQTIEGETHTLIVRIPVTMEQGMPEPLSPWLAGTGPSVRYIDCEGAVYDAEIGTGNMILYMVTQDHIMGEIDTATLFTPPPESESLNITGISFFVNL